MKKCLIVLVSLFSLGLMAQMQMEENKLEAAKAGSTKDCYVLVYGAGDARCPYGYIKYMDGVAMGCMTREEVSELDEAGELTLINYTVVTSYKGLGLVSEGFANYTSCEK